MKKIFSLTISMAFLAQISGLMIVNDAVAGDTEVIWRKDQLQAMKTIAILPPQSEAVIKVGDNQRTLDELEKPLSEAMLKEITKAFQEKGYQTQPANVNKDEYEKIKQTALDILKTKNNLKKAFSYSIDPIANSGDAVVLARLGSFVFDDGVTEAEVASGAAVAGALALFTGLVTPFATHHKVSGIFVDILIYDAKTGKIIWFKSDRLDGAPNDQNLVGSLVSKMLRKFP